MCYTLYIVIGMTNVSVFFFPRKCKTHPGPVVHISGNPADANKVGAVININLIYSREKISKKKNIIQCS